MEDKQMTDIKDIKIEIKQEYDTEDDGKYDSEINTSVGIEVKIEYDRLYQDHVIKDEIVVGPEVIQNTSNTVPPDVVDNDKNNSTTCHVQDKSTTKKHNAHFKCGICMKSFTRQYNLGLHLKRHETAEEILSCHLCKKVFSAQRTLTQHINYYCRLNKFKKEPGTHPARIKKKALKEALDKGLITSQDIQQDKIAKKKPKKQHICDICKKIFTRRYYLRDHMKLHSFNNKKLSCHSCDKVFNAQRSLTQHLKHYCPLKQINEPTSCQISTEVSALQENQDSNIKINSANNKEKPKSCNRCNKVLSPDMSLHRHNKYECQNKVKPLTCQRCKRVLLSEKALNIHLKYHCVNYSAKQITCKLCKNSFSQRYINRHLKYHCTKNANKPQLIKCKLCNKTSSTQGNIQKHLKYHCPINKNKRKSVSCKFCKKVLSSDIVLKSHVKNYCPLNKERAKSEPPKE